MVTTLNITLDDDVAKEARAVKESRGLTWAQFIEVAADELDRGRSERDYTPATPSAPEPETDTAQPDRDTSQSERSAPDPVTDEDVERAAREIDFGLIRKGSERDRQESLLSAYMLVKEQGQARRRDLKLVFDETATWTDSFDSWYENLVKEYLPELPGVEYGGSQGRGVWEYIGDDGVQ